MGFSGLSQSAFGGFGSIYSEGTQFGYSLKNGGGPPVTFFAGFDTLKYNSGIGSNAFAPFDTKSGTLPVSSAYAGVEFQPTSNLSLSLGVGVVQQTGRIDSEINSLPGASSFSASAAVASTRPRRWAVAGWSAMQARRSIARSQQGVRRYPDRPQFRGMCRRCGPAKLAS